MCRTDGHTQVSLSLRACDRWFELGPVAEEAERSALPSVCVDETVKGGFSCHPCPGMRDASKETFGVLSETHCRRIVWVAGRQNG